LSALQVHSDCVHCPEPRAARRSSALLQMQAESDAYSLRSRTETSKHKPTMSTAVRCARLQKAAHPISPLPSCGDAAPRFFGDAVYVRGKRGVGMSAHAFSRNRQCFPPRRSAVVPQCGVRAGGETSLQRRGCCAVSCDDRRTVATFNFVSIMAALFRYQGQAVLHPRDHAAIVALLTLTATSRADGSPPRTLECENRVGITHMSNRVMP
jgi:hypothetical protein